MCVASEKMQRDAIVQMIEDGHTPAEAYCTFKLDSEDPTKVMLCKDVFVGEKDADVPL
jgi:hypothetical protein